MSKRVEIGGKFYRMRKGKLVEIPAKWVGKTVDKRTMRNRRSKMTRQEKQVAKNPYSKGKSNYFRNLGLDVPLRLYDWSNYRERRYEMIEDLEELVEDYSSIG